MEITNIKGTLNCEMLNVSGKPISTENFAELNADNTFTGTNTFSVSTNNNYTNTINCVAPNISSGKVAIMNIGKEIATGNNGYVGFKYTGNNSANSYIQLGINGYNNLFKVYQNKSEFNVPLTINDTLTTTGAITTSAITLNGTDLETTLNGKADVGHIHSINDITNLQSTIQSMIDESIEQDVDFSYSSAFKFTPLEVKAIDAACQGYIANPSNILRTGHMLIVNGSTSPKVRFSYTGGLTWANASAYESGDWTSFAPDICLWLYEESFYVAQSTNYNYYSIFNCVGPTASREYMTAFGTYPTKVFRYNTYAIVCHSDANPYYITAGSNGEINQDSPHAIAGCQRFGDCYLLYDDGTVKQYTGSPPTTKNATFTALHDQISSGWKDIEFNQSTRRLFALNNDNSVYISNQWDFQQLSYVCTGTQPLRNLSVVAGYTVALSTSLDYSLMIGSKEYQNINFEDINSTNGTNASRCHMLEFDVSRNGRVFVAGLGPDHDTLAYAEPYGNATNALRTLTTSIAEMLHPIGSIYHTLSNIHPKITFGFGEWELIDRFLYPTTTPYEHYKAAGAATHTHTTNATWSGETKLEMQHMPYKYWSTRFADWRDNDDLDSNVGTWGVQETVNMDNSTSKYYNQKHKWWDYGQSNNKGHAHSIPALSMSSADNIPQSYRVFAWLRIG